jgi:hypothetical protein
MATGGYTSSSERQHQPLAPPPLTTSEQFEVLKTPTRGSTATTVTHPTPKSIYRQNLQSRHAVATNLQHRNQVPACHEIAARTATIETLLLLFQCADEAERKQ